MNNRDSDSADAMTDLPGGELPSLAVVEPRASSDEFGARLMADGQQRHPVDLLADEYSARCRAGESPSIEDYERQAPEFKDQIRSLFPTIAMIERLTRQETQRRRTKSIAIPKQKIIGDFQILREIGRGGMGIVYEAIQKSLERRVALKVLSSGISSSPRQLERFRREAESAARLHHTNIVPVYGIGEEDGVHFYAMQFIDGIPLADAIETVRHRSSGHQTSDIHSESQHTGTTGESESNAVSVSADRTVLVDLNSEISKSNLQSAPASEAERSAGSLIADPTPMTAT
jgi:hypothetical protein